MLQVNNLSIKYDKEYILKDLSLEVHQGEILALLGDSGSGKTTLLKSISGINPVTEGIIKLKNREITNVPSHRRNIAVVFQDLRLFPHLSVRDNIAFPLKMKKVPKGEWEQRINKLLKDVQLEGFQNRSVDQLSGGQQQRIALARALVSQPDLLLLDEPFSSLDEPLRVEMRQLLKELQSEHQITTLIVTHDKSEAMQVSSRIAFLHQQQIYQIGPQSVFKAQPRDKYVADFFGEANYVEGEIKNNIFYSSIGTFPAEEENISDGIYSGMIRPAKVSIEPTSRKTSWKIQRIEEGLQFVTIYIESEFGNQWQVYQSDLFVRDRQLSNNQYVEVKVQPEDIWYLNK